MQTVITSNNKREDTQLTVLSAENLWTDCRTGLFVR